MKSAILLVGSGRMARHLSHWNSLISNPNTLLFWNRQQNTEQLQKALNECDHVWLAISDSSLVSFYETHLAATGLPVTHFSGALHDERMTCAHPLMSFPQALLPDTTYPQIHFVINGAHSLHDLLPNFSNSFSILDAEKKALYHALCVLAGNFPQLLWNEVSQQMDNLKLPPAALDLYIRQITENYLIGKESAITGPLVRKDFSTIEKNISSLKSHQKLNQIYTSFSKEFTV